MEAVSSTTDQQSLVSSFLEIAVGQTADTARQFLQATSWKLEDAIQLFYIGNEGGTITPASDSTTKENVGAWVNPSSSQSENYVAAETVGKINGDEVRAPLPVIREALYDDGMMFGLSRMQNPPHESSTPIAFRNFQEEMKRPGVWAPEQGATSTTDNARDNLASLYSPPFHLMFNGPFDKAKNAASVQDRWLLVNLQSTKEFSSHMLNRDTWANEAVSQTISSNFIFWQVYDDTTEGQKVCTYYKLDSIPVVLVIDPITGLKMRAWFGMVQPDRLLEDMLPFMDGGPRNHHVTLSHKRPRASPTKRKIKEVDEEDEEIQKALAASLGSLEQSINVTPIDNKVMATEKEEEKSPNPESTYPPLPEEPTGDRSLLCRVGIRLPNGHRVQRNFLKTDPVQLLWSFCSSQLGEDAIRSFRLTHAFPGSSKSLDYDGQLSFGESGLANSMISVTLEK